MGNNGLLCDEPFTTTSLALMNLKEKASENSVEKGENAGIQYLLIFPPYFLLYQRKILPF